MIKINNLNKRNSILESRISFLVLFTMILVGLYSILFFAKSVLDHKSISVLAKQQYIIEKQIPYQRGIIYFRDGKDLDSYYPMALNEDKYQLLVVPKNINDSLGTAKKLSEIIEKDYLEIHKLIDNDKLYIPPIAKKMSKDKALKILSLNLSGVLIMTQQNRLYPEDNLASQILGFVDAENIGRYGLEGHYDNELIGKSGEVVAEKDILGRFISIGSQIDAKDGANIYTTIDRNIQYMSNYFLKEAIKNMDAQKGSMVVVNAKTGGVVSMVSLPDFDPNRYYEVAEEHPEYFMNPVVSSAWEPGSVMKPIVMSMAMDLGLVEPETRERFGGNVWIQGYEIRNAMNRTFGDQNMSEVLQNSDNIAMTWLSKKMSKDEMMEYFQKFGFGEKTKIDLDAEATGHVLNINDWREISQATMSFGQGISVTPIQLVMAYSALVNEGKLMQPYIVDKIVKQNGEVIATQPNVIRQVITNDTSSKIKNMLKETIERGYDIAGNIKGYDVGGKTGTAQIPKKDGPGYEDNSQLVHTFCGYIPVDDTDYVVLIVLDRPKKHNFASDTTAPVFADFAKWILNYLEIKPKS
jgi:stage V sporulation protein D (sporulation-specific penicillin-binding protein)